MKGKKTYLVGAVALASASLLWWVRAIDTGQAATLIFIGLGLITLRHGLSSERIRLLLELLEPYRPSPPAGRSPSMGVGPAGEAPSGRTPQSGEPR